MRFVLSYVALTTLVLVIWFTLAIAFTDYMPIPVWNGPTH